MKNLAIFPCNNDTLTLLNNRCQITDYNLSSVISIGQDMPINAADFSDVRFTSAAGSIISNVDSVLLTDNIQYFDLENYKDIIKIALDNNKELVLSSFLYRLLVNKEYLNCNDPVSILKSKHSDARPKLRRFIKDLDTPIISVLGLGENCSKFNMQIQLASHISKLGYKVKLVASNPLGSLMNQEILPDFLYSKEFTFEHKVYMFNEWVRALIDRETPDIIIMGNPGGIAPMNEFVSNFFAEIPLILSNAISSDAGVLGVYNWNIMSEEFIAALVDKCKIAFEIPVEMIYLSPTNISYNEEHHRLSFRFFDYDFSNKNRPGLIDEIENPMFVNLIDDDNIKSGFDHILGLLEEEVRFV